MDIPVETWYAAIFHRSSRRTYLPKTLEENKLERLRTVCREFRPFPGARAELVLSSPERIFKGLAGHYGRVNGALHYVAFIGEMNSPIVQEAVGYLGEAIILEATALGLDTCWVGGFFRADNVRQHLDLQDNEAVLSVTPVGYAPENKDLNEKLMSGIVRARRRKPLAELVTGEIAGSWMKKALEAARLAPSAQNRQPWLFRTEKKSVVISENKARSTSFISKRLDCGIAMLHFELGARAGGIAGRWDFLEPPDVARYIVEL
jgi:nitroreductase